MNDLPQEANGDLLRSTLKTSFKPLVVALKAAASGDGGLRGIQNAYVALKPHVTVEGSMNGITSAA